MALESASALQGLSSRRKSPSSVGSKAEISASIIGDLIHAVFFRGKRKKEMNIFSPFHVCLKD